jgi:large subunit ribosomal protein L30
MMLVIRISGQIGLSSAIKTALYRLRLRRKYSAILMRSTPENTKLLKKIRNHISYGSVDKETVEKLIEERGRKKGDKRVKDAKEIVKGLDKKTLSDLGLKPFFRLHPPKGGIESKKHFGVGKGVLGENKKMSDLVRRML